MLIDIYTDRYEQVGTEEKTTAHQHGLWHRTFSCLLVNPATQTVVLQKKAPGRYAFEGSRPGPAANSGPNPSEGQVGDRDELHSADRRVSSPDVTAPSIPLVFSTLASASVVSHRCC
jgi:isopentenyldiphosphate isomerase